jgi:hypothetical protein
MIIISVVDEKSIKKDCCYKDRYYSGLADPKQEEII